jgi:hydrogenase large subunit
MHLYILAGPDYSRELIERTNPEIWSKARLAVCKNTHVHGYTIIGDIMTDLNKPDGKLYLEALGMIRKARNAYTCLGGKYPHSESIIPGGVSIDPQIDSFTRFKDILTAFTDYSRKTIAVWDDIFDFLLDADQRYEEIGKSPATMVDFGQWDNEEFYDGTYRNSDKWGEMRWSTPGVVVNGKLVTTKLSEINAGLEEFVDHSYYDSWVEGKRENYLFKEDPAGNPISPYHPWNKKVYKSKEGTGKKNAYSWGSSTTWQRHTFEVGAYARMYISALAQKVPKSQYVISTGKSLEIYLSGTNKEKISWKVPSVWNAFERNRARAYAVAFNYAMTLENYDRALALISKGVTQVQVPMRDAPAGLQPAAGLWGAGRGFLAHWAVLNDGCISNYQLAVPSRINVSPRSPWGTPGPSEQAILNTPILESGEFTGVDIQRALQSFDPCMTCTTHIHIADSGEIRNGVVDTSFPI